MSKYGFSNKIYTSMKKKILYKIMCINEVIKNIIIIISKFNTSLSP